MMLLDLSVLRISVVIIATFKDGSAAGTTLQYAASRYIYESVASLVKLRMSKTDSQLITIRTTLLLVSIAGDKMA